VREPSSRDAAPTVDTSLPRDRDAALQACRRIDWRFLLEDPWLSRLGYGGRRDQLLIDACRRFAATFAFLEDTRAPMPASLDTVVLVDPDAELLADASLLLRPGGSLYAELSGRGRTVSRCVERLRALDLAEIRTHWHIPDFATAAEIVPLGRPDAISTALRRHAGSGTGRLAFLAGRVVRPSRVALTVARHISVTARAPLDDATA
jgi:hypothetical protein